MNISEPISVGSYNLTGIQNIREIVGRINQSIVLMKNGRDDQIADILKDIGEAIIRSPQIDTHSCQTAMEILRNLAWEASLPSADRRLGIVKADLAYMPMLLGTNPSVLNCFEVHQGDLRNFFNISA